MQGRETLREILLAFILLWTVFNDSTRWNKVFYVIMRHSARFTCITNVIRTLMDQSGNMIWNFCFINESAPESFVKFRPSIYFTLNYYSDVDLEDNRKGQFTVGLSDDFIWVIHDEWMWQCSYMLWRETQKREGSDRCGVRSSVALEYEFRSSLLTPLSWSAGLAHACFMGPPIPQTTREHVRGHVFSLNPQCASDPFL